MSKRIFTKGRIMRPFSTFAHLTYKAGKPLYKYENLARNGYIYRWSIPLLKRFKVREGTKIKPVKRKK